MTAAIEFLRQWHRAIFHYHIHEPWECSSIFKRLIKTLRRSDTDDSRQQETRKETLARLYFNLGILRAYDGEFFLAGKAFQNSIDCREDLVIAWYGRGLSDFFLEKYKDAYDAFSKACWLIEQKRSSKITTNIIDWRFLPLSKDYHPLGSDVLAITSWDLRLIRIEWNRRRAGMMFEPSFSYEQRHQFTVNGIPAGFMLPPPDDILSLRMENFLVFRVLNKVDGVDEETVKDSKTGTNTGPKLAPKVRHLRI